MATRPFPDGPLVNAVFAGSENKLKYTYMGLYETPLGGFYGNLNFDQALVIAHNSRLGRERDPGQIERLAESGDVYSLFNYLDNLSGVRGGNFYAFLRNNSNGMEERKRVRYGRMNPFKGRNLRERLERVDTKEIERLKEALVRPVLIHKYEAQYLFDSRQGRDGPGNIGAVCMGFQYASKKRSTPEGRAERYAKEIAWMISRYGNGYEPYPPEPRKEQGRLF